jgi:hypothetical protein
VHCAAARLNGGRQSLKNEPTMVMQLNHPVVFILFAVSTATGLEAVR